MIPYMTPENLGSSSLDIYRLLLQGIQPRRNWRDDRLPFTTSKFSGQERQMIISPSAFTVMKPKSKKYELTEEIVSPRKPFPAAFNSFRCEFYLDVVRCHPEMWFSVSVVELSEPAIFKPYCYSHVVVRTIWSCEHRWVADDHSTSKSLLSGCKSKIYRSL